MALSTLDGSKTQAHTVCPHCGRSVDTARRSSVVETGLSVLAGLRPGIDAGATGIYCLEVVF